MTQHRPYNQPPPSRFHRAATRSRRSLLPLLIAGALTGSILAVGLAGSQGPIGRSAPRDVTARAPEPTVTTPPALPEAAAVHAHAAAEPAAEGSADAAGEPGHFDDLLSLHEQPDLVALAPLGRDLATPPSDAADAVEGNADGAAAADADLILKTVSVGKGDTLLKLMTNAGADRVESHEAVSALRKLYNPKRLQRGQEITLTFTRDEDEGLRLQSLNLAPSVERTVAVLRLDDGGFTANETMVPLTTELVRAGGVITNSLFMTAQRAGIPAPVMIELTRLFSYDVDFQREVHPGDSFEVYFERLVDENGRPAKDGDILFAEMVLGGEALRYWRYAPSDSGEVDYFNDDGQSVRKALLRTPVDGARLTSGFGMRQHPILGYSLMHKGVDFGAPSGTPVMAAGDGVVEVAGWNGGYGKYLRIKHNGTYATAYAHLSGFASDIRRGQRVRQGQIVGYVGTTGRSTGPHLHYEVIVDNAQVNPLSIRLPTGRKLAGAELSRFRRAVDRLTLSIAETPLQTKLARVGD